MGPILGLNLLTHLLLGVVVILISLVYWIFRRQDYFKNHNVPYAKSIPLLGSFSDAVMGKIAFYDNITTIYNQPEVKDKPFFGIHLFHKPGLMITDPELIKRILVKVNVVH